ncbi:MAG: hypothetical protein V2A73_05340, partial [Pseudomonadota bacterium]
MSDPTVLVVASSPEAALIVERLACGNLRCLAVSDSAEEMLAAWQQLQPDVIVLAARLEKSDPLEFARALRGSDKTPPALVLIGDERG